MYKSFEDYIANTTKAQRQAHANLAEDCSFKGKSKDYTSKRRSQDAARTNIVEYLVEKGILDISLLNQKFGKTGQVQVNHLCSCHSGKDDVVCNNPKHLYLGTASENYHDVDTNTGKTAYEKVAEIRKTPAWKQKASQIQKESWLQRKLAIIQSDKE
jgi:hypothetical protein